VGACDYKCTAEGKISIFYMKGENYEY